MISSTSTRWLARSVLPVETRSTIASASPVSGASSIEPYSLIRSTCTPLSEKCSRAICVYLVATRIREPCRTAFGVVEVGAHRDAHPAARDLQVERLVQALAAVLDQRVLAGHAEVGAAVLDIGRHVAGAHQHDAHVGPVGADDQLARLLRILGDLDPGGREQRQRLVEDAALGQCQRDHAPCPRSLAPGADARAAWPPSGRNRDRGGRCGRPASAPSATSPAITRLADARRSVAITVAPDRSLDAVDHRGMPVDLDLRAEAASARRRA